MKKYIQEKNLPDLFDLSKDFFTKRKESEFIKGIHYFVPPTKSVTKKAVLWDIGAVDDWIRGNQAENEVLELLKRK